MNPSTHVSDIYLLSRETQRDMARGLTADVPGSDALRNGQKVLLQATIDLSELEPVLRAALVARMHSSQAISGVLGSALCLYAHRLADAEAITALQDLLRACSASVRRDRDRTLRVFRQLERLLAESVHPKLRKRQAMDVVALDRKAANRLFANHNPYYITLWSELQPLRGYLFEVLGA